MPVFNTGKKLLDRSIESALAQDACKEIIIVDDGSEPECSSYLDELQAQHADTIKVIHQPNCGVSSARNRGLRAAKGEFVAFLDADDELEPVFLASAKQILEDAGADIVMGGIAYQFDNGAIVNCGNVEIGDAPLLLEGSNIEVLMGSIFNKDAMRRMGLKPAMYVSNCSALYRRSLIEDVTFREDIAISEDRLFNLDAFLRASRVILSGAVWYRYHQNRLSASQRIRPNAREELVSTAETIENYVDACPSSIHDDMVVGIAECFMQTIEFTVLRKGFRDQINESERSFVRSLLNIGVYKRAFNLLNPKGFKMKLLKHMFIHQHPFAIIFLFKANKHLYNLKHVMYI